MIKFKSPNRLSIVQLLKNSIPHLVLQLRQTPLILSLATNFQIWQNQLSLNVFHFCNWIKIGYISFGVNNIYIFKTADQMDDGIYFSDISEELIS